MAQVPLDKTPSTHVWVDVEGPLRTTELALLYQTSTGEIWVPISQMGARKKNAEGTGHCRIEIPRWLAIEKGITTKT